jgi:hypothetical protein
MRDFFQELFFEADRSNPAHDEDYAARRNQPHDEGYAARTS